VPESQTIESQLIEGGAAVLDSPPPPPPQEESNIVVAIMSAVAIRIIVMFYLLLARAEVTLLGLDPGSFGDLAEPGDFALDVASWGRRRGRVALDLLRRHLPAGKTPASQIE